MPAHGLAVAALLALPVTAWSADAPAPSSPPPIQLRVVPATPLPLPSPIAQGAPVCGVPFQWTGLNRERLLRNVLTATMDAVRPAAGKANGRAVLLVPGCGDLLFQPAVDDAKAAMRWACAHAADFAVHPAQIGSIGFSAGARTGQRLVEQAEAGEMPANLALIDRGLSTAKPKTLVPTLFAAQALDDPLFPVTGIDLLHSWKQAGQRAELHLDEPGGHGFGLLKLCGTTADSWIDPHRT